MLNHCRALDLTDDKGFLCGKILADLGVRKMSLLSAPKVFHGLAGFGLEVVDYYAEQE